MDTIIAVMLMLSSIFTPLHPNDVIVLPQTDFILHVSETINNAVEARAMRMSNTNPTQTVETSAASIVIAIDVSDSMYGVPLEEAQRMAKYVVNSIDAHTEVALVTFANTAEVLQEYTTDRNILNEKINSLYTQGVTALYDGSYEAVEMAVYSDADNRLVILLSDGGEYGEQSNAGRDDALRLAEIENVSIITVGIGSWTDAEYLTNLANGTNGQAFDVAHVTQLPDIYMDIVDQITVLESSGRTVEVVQSSPKIPPLSTPVPDSTISAEPITPVVNVPKSNTAFINGPAPDAEGDEPITSDTVDPQALVDPSTPQFNQPTSTAIVLALDVSDSMYGFPLERAIAVTQDFIAGVDSSIPIAIVSFANKAQVLQDFTTNRLQLTTTVQNLRTGGATALYDGADLAVEVATTADVTNPVVILLSDGGEYGGLSDAQREDALLAAQTAGVEVIAVGYGNWIDTNYLTDLTSGTSGELLVAKDLDDLNIYYGDLISRFEVVEPSVLSVPDVAGESADVFGNDFLPEQGEIPSIDNEILELDLPNDGTTLALPPITQTNPLEIVPLDTTETEAEVLESASGEDVLEVVETPQDTIDAEIEALETEMGITNNIMPISIDLGDQFELKRADMTLNGFLLASFTSTPVEYDLDLGMLDSGLYKLTVQMQDVDGDIRVVNSEFEVSIISQLPLLGGTNDDESVPGFDTPVLDEAEAPRLVLVDGRAGDLNFIYSVEDGLVHESTLNQEVVVEKGTETLGDILAKPLEYIPEPIRIALTTPNPELVAIIIVVMTVVLLPQGLFTLYWMMYTWNHPDKLEESRSPAEFIEPQYSFTAILPARKEQDVIRQTIHTVNNIDYPDHLKEILIMIRDEDDDETIAESYRAIEEIGKDNIRVVTFTDGPKNKPNGLNRGLKASTKDIVCIFDAEDEPHPEIYNVVNTVLVQKQADVVQSGVQLMNFDSNWFSAFNVLEYFFWFKSGLHAFTRQFNVTPLGGNTVFFKREWLQRINGWDEQCLTEDADVGLRLTQLGAKIEIVYDEKHATQEETPDTVESFIKQRTRWVQGFYQIFFKWDWARLPMMKQKIVALYILLNSLFQAAMLIFLPIGIYIAATQQIPVPLALLSYLPIYILLIQMAINLIGIREFTSAYQKRLPMFFTLKMILYYYPYQIMMAVAALRAVFRMMIGQAAWEKTSHSNLHRLAMES